MPLPKKYETWDRITMTLEQHAKIGEWWGQQRISTVSNLPLTKGLIICKEAAKTKSGLFDVYLSFEMKPDGIYLSEFYSFDFEVQLKWELKYDGTIIDNEPNFQIAYEPQYSGKTERMLDMTVNFLSVLHFIANFKEIKETVSTKVYHNKKSPKKSSKGKSSKVRYIPSTHYQIKDIDKGVEQKRKLERHTEAWHVRGHPRHYKNGKIVWIKPYVKGDKSKVEPVSYEVKDFDLPSP